MIQRKFWMNFISYIQAIHAKYWNNYQQKIANELHSYEHEFLKREIMLQVYCYEHVWINQNSDLTLINLIKASHDAMSSLNLAHFFESFSTLLLVVQHFLHSFLSSFF